MSPNLITQLERIARTFRYKGDTLADHLAVMNRVDAIVIEEAIKELTKVRVSLNPVEDPSLLPMRQGQL